MRKRSEFVRSIDSKLSLLSFLVRQLDQGENYPNLIKQSLVEISNEIEKKLSEVSNAQVPSSSSSSHP